MKRDYARKEREMSIQDKDNTTLMAGYYCAIILMSSEGVKVPSLSERRMGFGNQKKMKTSQEFAQDEGVKVPSLSDYNHY